MQPSRPDLSAKSNEELILIVSSAEYIADVRTDAKRVLLSRGVVEHDIPASARPVESECGDPRKPVLYLRPFSTDEMTSRDGLGKGLPVNAEGGFLQPIAKLGPVVAIGRPGERHSPRGTLARRVYAEDEWQPLFHELLDKAGYVVLFAGTTSNFQWEMEQVFKHDPFVPTILLLPFFQHPPWSSKRREDIMAFVETFRRCSGLIPQDPQSNRVIFFPTRDRPIAFGKGEGAQFRALDYLNPYLPALVELLETIDPELALPFRKVASAFPVSLAIAAVIWIFLIYARC